MTKKTSVIIGAGQTGRGFIAPFLQNVGHHIVFLDASANLVQQLKADNDYTVSYCGGMKEPLSIRGYEAFHIAESIARQRLAEADYIFTAVGESNIAALAPILIGSVDQRKSQGKDSRPILVTCENGTSPKKALVDAKLDEDISITEGIVFCTTLRPDPTSLDLLSEAYPEIPYDADAVDESIDVPGFKPTTRFHTLIERKIFTYNCLSACVSYLGDYKGYEDYGFAANDEEISRVMSNLVEVLNNALASRYQVDLAEQKHFGSLAIEKFKNRDIVDTIARNARDVKRKLGPEERLIKPLRILLEFNQGTGMLEMVIAAALHYGIKGSDLDGDGEIILNTICQIEDLPLVKERVLAQLELFESNESLSKILIKE